MLFIIIKATDLILPERYVNSPMLSTYELGKSKANPHFHIIMDTYDPIPTVRYHFKKLYTKNNGVRITQVKDLDKSCIYILKDGNLIKNSLLTDEQLLQFQQDTEVINQDKKSKNYLEKMVNSYIPISAYQCSDGTINTFDYAFEHIIRYVCDYTSENLKMVDIFIIRRFSFTIYNRYYKLSNNEYIINKIKNIANI